MTYKRQEDRLEKKGLFVLIFPIKTKGIPVRLTG